MFRTSLMASVALSMDAGLLRGKGGDDQPWGLLTMADQQAAGIKDWGLNIITIGPGDDMILSHAPHDLMKFPSAVESNNACHDRPTRLLLADPDAAVVDGRG